MSETLRLDRGEYIRRVLITIGLISLVTLVMLLLWAAADVALLVFGAILFALFLRGLSDLLRQVVPLSENWSLAIVLLGLAIAIGLSAWLLGLALVEQLTELAKAVSSSWQQVQAQIEENEWGKRLVEDLSSKETLPDGTSIVHVTSFFSMGIGGVLSAVVVVVAGIYLAFDPHLYRHGLIRLTPLSRRARMNEVLDALGTTLRGWLISQFCTMTVVGTATTIGLWLLGTPLAIGLGLVAFVVTFVPYVGPIASAIPAILVAFTVGPTHAIYVGILYLGIQVVESNLLAPLLQQRMAKLPPAVTIISQVLMGVLLGTAGVVFATPLAACAMVLVTKVYVEDTLGDSKKESS